ncbi:MAG TPA: glycosyltransferase family 4 protein [Caldilineae bacterium]|nr:glycosyltransferase family 4 protein [Caldilineae bacterium]
MRIALVGTFGLRVRGTMWRRALPLARSLAQRGHEPTLIVPPWDSPEDEGRVWDDHGVQVVHARVRHPAQIMAEMLRAVLASRPDLVHVFKPKAYAGLVLQTLWYARRIGLWHGGLVLDADDWEGPGGWNDRMGYPIVARWLFAWQERWGFRHADALTVASRWLAMQAKTMGARHVVHLPNGVDAIPRPRPRRPNEAPPTALLLTRFIEFAPGDVVSIWMDIRRRVPEARLIIAGEALQGEDRALRRMLASASLADGVTWWGLVPFEAIPQLCAASDVALFPARAHRITLAKCPARLTDVMAAGLPAVASRVGEHETYIMHGETGFLVPPGDLGAFAEATTWLLQDREQAYRMGEEAQRHVIERFNWDRLAATVERAYELAMERRT